MIFTDKNVIVTGGSGSVGAETVAQVLSGDAKTIRVVDNDESGLFEMQQNYLHDQRVQFICSDIQDDHEMMRIFRGMDYCFHTAALKHVPSCEVSPFSAIGVNIDGVKTVIRASIANDLERVLFTSSDKAVNPTNVMGTSKLMGERLFTAANSMGGADGETIFASTRFGNVAGSRGSVIPLFCNQIKTLQKISLTDEQMTRFIMSKKEAVELVIQSLGLAKGGEVFITKMPVMRIIDLARAVIEMVAPPLGYQPDDIEIEIVGSRPGEKLWEELSTDEESRRILEGDKFLAVLPAIGGINRLGADDYPELGFKISEKVYHSDREEKLSVEEIKMFLRDADAFPDDLKNLL